MTKKNTKGNILKVVELGIENKVFDAMRKPGFSAEALSREFLEDGIKITAQSIRKFIKKSTKAQKEIIATDIREMQKFKELTMNYEKALKDILDEVQEVKNTSKEEKDYTTYNQLIGRLYQGIELIAKLSGDLKPTGSVDINLIYNEITNNLTKKMKQVNNVIFKEDPEEIDLEILREDMLAKSEIMNE